MRGKILTLMSKMRRGKGYTVSLHGRRRRKKLALTSGCRRYLALLLWRRGFCHLREDRCQPPGSTRALHRYRRRHDHRRKCLCGSSVGRLTASGLTPGIWPGWSSPASLQGASRRNPRVSGSKLRLEDHVGPIIRGGKGVGREKARAGCSAIGVNAIAS